MKTIASVIAFLLLVVLVIASVAGWVTNVIWTFSQDTVIPLVLGVVGIFAAPIGALHGIYLWF